MKKIAVIFFVLLMLFESCAIHKEFPFICFNGECVANQLKFKKVKASLKASFTKMSLKASMRKKKRYANKRKSNLVKKNTDNSNEPVYSESGIATFEVLKPDSVLSVSKPDSSSSSTSTFGFNVGIGNLDTVIILKYKVSMDAISHEDSLMLRNFFNYRQDQKMREIIIQEYIQPNAKSNNSQRINNIRKYLIELKVPNFIITVNSPISLPEGKKDERVEVKIF